MRDEILAFSCILVITAVTVGVIATGFRYLWVIWGLAECAL